MGKRGLIPRSVLPGVHHKSAYRLSFFYVKGAPEKMRGSRVYSKKEEEPRRTYGPLLFEIHAFVRVVRG
jgi:hypothetical protein